MPRESSLLGTSNAVWCRRLYKRYGKGKNKVSVLTGLNLNVPYGAIYGLLGSSGCGKTTLLRCIIGLLKVDSGSLLAMGDVPAARGHSIPGSMVGYMPQKRRVSLAAALLHKPGLLILDEPTVGVDPLLREKIWQHLLEIAQSSDQTTIIVTTHYIEEARQADRVGLMRGGRLLDEDSPSKLVERYNMPSLENIFLHLCQHDVAGNAQDEELMSFSQSGNYRLDSSTSNEGFVDYHDNTPLREKCAEDTDKKPSNGSMSTYGTVSIRDLPRGKPRRAPLCTLPSVPKFHSMLAVIIKNLTILKRSIGVLLFQFSIPAIQIILFCLCIGRPPHDVKLAVANLDKGSLGATYLQCLDNTTFTQVAFDDLDAGKKSVERGETFGVLYITPDFSDNLVLRMIMGINVTTEVVEGSTIYLYLDLTNQEISTFIQKLTLTAFQHFSESQLASLGLNTHYSDAPVLVSDPIYGTENSLFTDFITPGVIDSIIFFMAIGLTTLAFVIEKKEGLYERNLVNGVTPTEVMLGYVVTQFLVLLVQVGLMLLFAFTVFHVPAVGNYVWIVSLLLLQGVCGMCMGILISSICDRETSAIQMALGVVYPLLLISGIIWPLQAEPKALAYISDSLPLTLATDALRSIMGRGWGMQHFGVWIGFIVCFGWCITFLCVTAIVIRLKS